MFYLEKNVSNILFSPLISISYMNSSRSQIHYFIFIVLLWIYIEWTICIRGCPTINEFVVSTWKFCCMSPLNLFSLFLNCFNPWNSSFCKYLLCYSYFILIFCVYYSFWLHWFFKSKTQNLVFYIFFIFVYLFCIVVQV